MQTDDPQKVWEDYYHRKKSQRLEEAAEMWSQMKGKGVDEETVLALDFVHFGKSHSDVQDLADQLSEHYTMDVVPNEQQGYWFAKGTTRPDGITLNREEHLNWVEFMSDVAQSYACVFSSWSLEAPAIGAKFDSEKIVSAS